MCTTIMQQVLANPSADLPAQYNTFLLHFDRGLSSVQGPRARLQIKLTEETECNQTTADEFRGAISSWPLNRA